MHRFVVVITMVLAMTIIGCTTSSVAPSVTCEGIRRLHVGMSPSQVEAIIGRPIYFNTTGTRTGTDLNWSYVAHPGLGSVGGVDFYVHFYRGALRTVSVYKTYVWDARATTLYHLGADGRTDTPELGEYVPCETPPQR